MTKHLFRLCSQMSEPGLIEALRHPEKVHVELVDHEVDLSALDSLILDLNSRGAGIQPSMAIWWNRCTAS